MQSAGGFTLYAKETRVTLTRDRKAYDFDVKLAQRQPEQDPILIPGDSIQVPARRSVPGHPTGRPP